MDIEVDILEFRVPIENNKTIFVWDIQPSDSEAYIYECLWNVYSEYGALYLVKLCENAAWAKPGFYALVKFYSSNQAATAQRATDKQCLFQSSPLKVRLSTKKDSGCPYYARPLSDAKCQELANHYLGFNGWSSRIVTLKDLSNCGQTEMPASDGHSQETLLKFGCIIELTFPQHGISCRGVGVTEEMIDTTIAPENFLRKRKALMKWTQSRALVNAFEKVLLLVLGNGKVAIECRIDPDEILPDEDFKGVLKVNDISWSQLNTDEEDELPWEFTVDLSQ
ncbi:RAD52 motif-containing protein 1 [Chanos chanos]|uniref:RAD52 motif-containing protein 1 n=1 Tax=Chanos chanos TaxID=29144 RepID=A0A6J2WZY3_CHACN|nr:RAD52 motif-containing protein 1 [Chanos chanos]